MEFFSVRSGIIHKMVRTFIPKGSHRLLTKCGRRLTPVKVYETAAEANAELRGDLDQMLCSNCRRADL